MTSETHYERFTSPGEDNKLQSFVHSTRGKIILTTVVLGVVGLVAGLIIRQGVSSSEPRHAQALTGDKVAPQPTSIEPTTWTPSPTTAQLKSHTSSPTSHEPATTSKPSSTTKAPTPAPTPSPIYGKINDNTPGTSGQTTNPKTFPNRGCKLPNYLSENGHLYAQAPNGTKIPIFIKGINWFGMETELNIPFGLWANPDNGTSLYEIVAFLSRHRFNSVRLPLTVDSLIKNTPPNPNVVNAYESPALNLTTYMSAVQSLVVAMGSKGISVLLDIHYLSDTDKGDAWYSVEHPASMTLNAIDILTINLCSDTYWNVIGIDLTNEPWNTTWGDNGAKDFRIGAALLGNRMLANCPSWLAFIEGNAQTHTITINGTVFDYYDWWGGGL
ncbi:cell 5A endo-1,4-betaglucanase, partial [Thraustotheca clavata]